MMRRAWSQFSVKNFNNELRELEGWASTLTTDKVGDIVCSEGVQYTLPIPLLHHHDHRKPIGHVVRADVRPNGIWVKAQIAKVLEPGALKDRCDTAWAEIRHGLLRGLSIGFTSLEATPIKTGMKFLRWAWHELSCVVVPAQVEATIQQIKTLDTTSRHCASAAVATVPFPRIVTPQERSAHRWFLHCCDKLALLQQVARPGAFRLSDVGQLTEQLRLAELNKAHAYKELQQIRGIR